MKKPNHLFQSMKLPIKFVILIWVVHFVQVMTIDFGFLGVRPREIYGLKGVIFSPLIHGDLPHLISNTIPFLVTAFIILFFYKKVAIRAIIMIYLLTGLAVWAFARPVWHIGASGVVYGLVSFIFWNGIFRRNLKSIVLSLIIVFLYSGLIVGVLPNQEGISWESHLLGGIVGIFTSFWYKDEIEQDEEKQVPSWEREGANQNEQFFLNRDAFEKTRNQRRWENDENKIW